METYKERSLHIKYHSQGVQTSFYESTPSKSNPLGDQVSPGARGNSRHAGTNHPHASKERDNRGASKLPRILLKRLPGTKSFRRVASSSKLHSKRRLRVQNRSAGCVLSHTYPSQQQKVPQVLLREQGVPVSGATLRSEHSPSGVYSIRAHGDKLSSPSGDLVIPYLDEWLIHHPDRQVLLTSGPAYKYTGPSRLYPKQKESRVGPDSGSPVSLNRFTSGLRGSFTSKSKAWEIVACALHLSSLQVLTYSQVSQLMGSLNWSYPSGSFVPEPLQRHFHSLGLTERFTPPRRSDPLVLANLLRHWQDLRFLTSGIPIRTFQAEFTIFTDASTQGWGAHMGIPRFRVPGPVQTAYQLSGAQGGSLCPRALGHSAPGKAGYDRYGQFDSRFLYQQGPFPHLVTFDSLVSPLVRGSEHNSPSKTYSRLSERDSTYLVRISQYRQSEASTPRS